MNHFCRDGCFWPIEISLVANHILYNDRIDLVDFLNMSKSEDLKLSFVPLIKFYSEDESFRLQLWMLMQYTIFLDPTFMSFEIPPLGVRDNFLIFEQTTKFSM